MNRYTDPYIDDPLRPAKGLFWNTLIAAIIWAVVIWLLCGCGQKRPAHPALEFRGSAAKTWAGGQAPAYNGAAAIESSLIYVGSNIFTVFTNGGSGDMHEANLGPNGDEFHSIYYGNLPRVGYPYTLQVGNVYYTFAHPHGSKDLLVWSSTDAIHWIIENGGLPVLTASTDPNSVFFNIWNPAVTVDNNGVWHMLYDCSTEADGDHSSLCYATSPDPYHFDYGKQTTYAIHYGGSPWIQYMPGKGLLAIIQTTDNTGFGNVWSVTAATMPAGATSWQLHEDRFLIGAQDDHICDPHALQMHNGRIMLTVSNNQAWIDIVYSSDSLETFWDKLTQ